MEWLETGEFDEIRIVRGVSPPEPLSHPVNMNSAQSSLPPAETESGTLNRETPDTGKGDSYFKWDGIMIAETLQMPYSCGAQNPSVQVGH